MNIVITTGHPYSGFQSVHTLLIDAGLTQASVSKREGMSATDFHQRVLSAHGVDLAMPTSLAPITPGRVWNDLAVDLFLGNLEVPDWGFADPGAVWLLDFWSQFDPQIRFVLVYATPEHVIAEMLRQGALSSEDIAPAMASWAACHTELLRFFHRHRDRCILVDSTAATSMPQRLVTKAVESLGLDLNPSRVAQNAEAPPQSVLEALLVGGLVPHDSEVSAIYAELEGTADLANDNDALMPNLVQAWGEYEQILVRLDQGAKEAQGLRETTARLEQKGKVAETKRAESQAIATAAADENELLLLQLHEVQAELEQYYLQCQTLEEAEKQRKILETTLATERAQQSRLSEEIERLRARAVEVEKAAATQLANKQKQFNGQVTLRKEAEERLAEAERRSEDLSLQLSSAKSAHSAAERRIREQADTALADQRTKRAALAEQIVRLKAEVANGVAAAKRLASTQTKLDEQVTARQRDGELLAEAARRTKEISQELIAAKSAHEATETTLRQQADLALAVERTKQAQLAGEIERLQVRVAEGESAAKQLAVTQAELDEQVAGRKQAELHVSELARKTEDLERELSAAKSAHETIEDALRQKAADEAAMAQEREMLLLHFKQTQGELEQQCLRSQSLEEADKRRQALEATLTTERAKQAKLADEIKRLQARVAEGETAAKHLAKEVSAAKSAQNATEKALRRKADQEAAMTQESEMLLLQLQQAQDELRQYHLQAEKSSYPGTPGSFPSGVTLNQLTQATVDLRGNIDGENWYDAEQDGRWAGPGQVSTLVLPALPVGQYQLALEVVDAIEPEVLNGMVLSLNGKPLAIQHRRRGPLNLVTADFSSETSAACEKWKLELSFPRLLSPAERGSDDHRTLAIRVRTLSIVPIRTESNWPVADTSGSGKWGGIQPTQISFDLRGPIDGDNWYNAEQDGRWAGPGHVSSLMLPALGAGRYQMELDVVDAMAPEIVNGMTVSLNGKPVSINPKCHGYPTLVTAEFSTDVPAPDGQWEVRISFPRVESPADHGSGDHRTLAIRLRTVSFTAIRPEEDRTALQFGGKRGSTKGSRNSYRWWARKK